MSSEDVDGVRAYRKNGRSVEGLTREELNDMMERFPRDSDAYMAASNQLQWYDELDRRAPIPTDSKEGDNH